MSNIRIARTDGTLSKIDSDRRPDQEYIQYVETGNFSAACYIYLHKTRPSWYYIIWGILVAFGLTPE